MKKLYLVLVLAVSVFGFGCSSGGGSNGGGNGDGECVKLYEVDDLIQLIQDVFDHVSADCYELENDIDLTEYISTHISSGGWPGIGGEVSNLYFPFKGTFDGKGHTISNLFINLAEGTNLGFFRIVEDATIKNLKIKVQAVVGHSKIGGLAGTIKNSTILNCEVVDEFVSRIYGIEGSVGYVGGIVGVAEKSTIKDTRFLGATTLTPLWIEAPASLGGIAGTADRSQFINVQVSSDVSIGNNGFEGVGGIVGSAASTMTNGQMNGSSINGCEVNANIKGRLSVGGIAGSMDFGSISNCNYTGTITSSILGASYSGCPIGFDMSGYSSLSNNMCSATFTTY
jgi:hypothetical protein